MKNHNSVIILQLKEINFLKKDDVCWLTTLLLLISQFKAPIFSQDQRELA